MAKTNPAIPPAPDPDAKYYLKKVYRDPETRKAYVVFVDADTGLVLSDLDGYTLWEAGGPATGGGTTTPGTGTSTGKGSGTSFSSPNMIEDRYLGRGEDREGLFGSVQRSGFGGVSDDGGSGTLNQSGSTQNVTSEQFPSGSGRITVTGQGPATEGVYDVNKPSTTAALASQPGGVTGYGPGGNKATQANPNFVGAGFTQAYQGVSNPAPAPSAPSAPVGGLQTNVDPRVIDTIVNEALANDYNDMKHVASVIANRSVGLKEDPFSIVSAVGPSGVKEFSAFGKEANRNSPQWQQAAQAYAEVMSTGPVTDATFYASNIVPGAVDNLLNGTPNLAYAASTKGHNYFTHNSTDTRIYTANGLKQYDYATVAAWQPDNPVMASANPNPAPAAQKAAGYDVRSPSFMPSDQRQAEVQAMYPDWKGSLTSNPAAPSNFVSQPSNVGMMSDEAKSFAPVQAPAPAAPTPMGLGMPAPSVGAKQAPVNPASLPSGLVSSRGFGTPAAPAPTAPAAGNDLLSRAAATVDVSQLAGKQRSEVPNPEILGVVAIAANNVLGPEWGVSLTSGKEPVGTNPVGAAERHPVGLAGDFQFENKTTGQLLSDPKAMQAIAVEANKVGGQLGVGFINAGYGLNYMGSSTIHLDAVQNLQGGMARSWEAAKAWTPEMEGAYQTGKTNPQNDYAMAFAPSDVMAQAPAFTSAPNNTGMMSDEARSFAPAPAAAAATSGFYDRALSPMGASIPGFTSGTMATSSDEAKRSADLMAADKARFDGTPVSRSLSGPIATQAENMAGTATAGNRSVFSNANDPRIGKTYADPNKTAAQNLEAAMADIPAGQNPDAVNEAIEFNIDMASDDPYETRGSVTVQPAQTAGAGGFAALTRGVSNFLDQTAFGLNDWGVQTPQAAALGWLTNSTVNSAAKADLKNDPLTPQAGKEWSLKDVISGKVKDEAMGFMPEEKTTAETLADLNFYSKPVQEALQVNPNDPNIPQEYREQYARAISTPELPSTSTSFSDKIGFGTPIGQRSLGVDDLVDTYSDPYQASKGPGLSTAYNQAQYQPAAGNRQQDLAAAYQAAQYQPGKGAMPGVVTGFNPDMYSRPSSVAASYAFGSTPVGGGMPAAPQQSWGEMISQAARGFAEGIGTAMSGAMTGGLGLGGRQSYSGNFAPGFSDRGGGFDSGRYDSGGSRFGDGNIPGEGSRGGGGGSSGGGDRGGDSRGGGGPSGGYDYGNGYSDAKDGGLGGSNGGGNQGGYTGGGPTSGPSYGGGGAGYTGGGPTSGPSGGGGYTGGGPTSGPSSSGDGKASGPSGGGYGGWGGPR